MRYRYLVPLLLVVLLPIAAAAQTATTTTVSGIVNDPQGGVIAGATVKLIDETTNNERTATTDSEGRYNFNAVSPGTYKVTVAAKGFKTTVVTDVTAEVSKVANVNVTLEVG